MKAFIASPLHNIHHPVYSDMYHNPSPRWDIISYVFAVIMIIVGAIVWDFFLDLHKQNKRIKERMEKEQ